MATKRELLKTSDKKVVKDKEVHSMRNVIKGCEEDCWRWLNTVVAVVDGKSGRRRLVVWL